MMFSGVVNHPELQSRNETRSQLTKQSFKSNNFILTLYIPGLQQGYMSSTWKSIWGPGRWLKEHVCCMWEHQVWLLALHGSSSTAMCHAQTKQNKTHLCGLDCSILNYFNFNIIAHYSWFFLAISWLLNQTCLLRVYRATGSTQGLRLPLCSGITCSRFREPYRDWIYVDHCRESTLPLSLWSLESNF